VADRYAYLPSFGIIYLVAAVLTRLVPERFTRVAMAGAGGLVLVLGLIAFVQNRVWQDEKTLWEGNIKSAPLQIKGYKNLGGYYLARREYQQAFAVLEQARRLDPGRGDFEMAEGYMYAEKGDYPAAVAAFRKVLSLKEESVEANYRLADAYVNLGQYDLAVAALRKALLSRGQDLFGFKAMAEKDLQVLLGRYTAELDTLRKRVAAAPRELGPLADLALRLDALGFYEEALGCYQKMLEVAPNSWQIYFNAANVCKKLGRLPDAATYYEKSLALNPAHADTLNNLGSAYQQLKQYDRAIAAFEQALAANSALSHAPLNLAITCLLKGDREKALYYFRYTAERFPELAPRVESYLKEFAAGEKAR
jgi:tetratricopeptide (TPR) repeat protein